MNRYKTLQEKAKAKGKLLLVESVSYIPKQDDVVILTDSKLTESINGKQYECRGILKNVPVTRYTENANGRIYSSELWHNVEKQGMFEGSDCLADHAEDDGSVLSTVGVWHNFKVGESTANADLYCIGEAGSLLLEKAKAGGKIGFSTVGFGELNESNGKEVLADSYEYENTDWVRKPSQNVFATIEHISESIEIKEESKTEKKILENKNTNIITNVLENNEVKTDMSEKFIEASLKMQVKQVLKEAENSGKPVEAIKELQEIGKTIPATMVEETTKIENMVSKLQEKVEADKLTAQKELKESKETLESLTKKYEVANETIKGLKKQLEKASKIVEKTANPKLVESIKAMEADISQFSKDRVLMESDIKLLTEDIKNMSEDIKCYEEDTELRDKDINKFKEERVKMKKKIDVTSKQLKVAEKHIAKLEKTLKEEFGYEFDDDVIGDEMIDDSAIMDDDLIDYDLNDSEMDLVMNDDFVDDDMIDYYEDEEDGVSTDDELVDEMYEETEDSEDNDNDDSDEDDKDDSKFGEEEDSDDEEEDEDSDDEEDDDEEEKKAESTRRRRIMLKKKQEQMKKQNKKPEIKKESKVRVIDAVQQYYQEQVRKTPALRDVRGSIMKSTSLSEAIEKIQRFKSRRFGNDVLKLDESTKKQEKYVDYVFDVNKD